MEDKFLSYLRCPQKGDELKLEEGELFSKDTSYPIFNNIPWLFKNSEFSFLEWGAKITAFIESELRTIKYLGILIQGEDKKLTQQRLKRLKEAKEKNLQIFHDKLALFLGHQQIKLTPSKQQIYSYFQLIFRDWSWESEENATYLEFIKDNTSLKPKNILVLGAGACGLSYQIAKHFWDAQVIATDHNPFLFFMANDIISGKEAQLTDYSFFPKNISSTTHQWNINAKPLKNNNHHMVLADYPHLPFDNECFDMIIAPWFFDILEINYENALYQSLKFLKPEGELFQIGPANVHSRHLYEQFSSDEQTHIYKKYFSAVLMDQKQIKYLENPIESQTRLEEVIFLKGLGKKDVKAPYQEKLQKEELKFSDNLQEYKLLNETIYKVLKHVSGDISYKELSEKVAGEFGFNEQEAEYYTDTILKKVLLEM